MGHSIPTQPVLPWAPSQEFAENCTKCAPLGAMKNPQASYQNSKRFRFYGLLNCKDLNLFSPSWITVFILKGVWKSITSFLYKAVTISVKKGCFLSFLRQNEILSLPALLFGYLGKIYYWIPLRKNPSDTHAHKAHTFTHCRPTPKQLLFRMEICICT